MSERLDKTELQHVWSIFSHDISTPLAILEIQLKALQKYATDPKKIEQILEESVHEVSRIKHLIARQNRKILHSRPLSQDVSISECLNHALKDKALIHDVTVNIEEAIIQGDPQWVEHVIYEILDNAQYAIQLSGSGKIQITSHIIDQKYVLHIMNSGQKIEPDHISQLFSPYFSNKKKVGLGLSFCRSAMEKMKGNIVLNSNNTLTEFLISFNLA